MKILKESLKLKANKRWDNVAYDFPKNLITIDFRKTRTFDIVFTYEYIHFI